MDEEMGDKSDDEVILECKNLVKIYKTDATEVMALQKLGLSINKGEFVAIIGKSGSGKSTLLNIIGGLETPTIGKVIYKGVEINTFTEKELTEYRRNNIGFVWQKSILNLFPYLTVIKNIEWNAYMNGKEKNRKQIHGNALRLLDEVGLSDRANSYPTQLSGGEQQRAAIAVGLINEPKILLADEPTGAVDEHTKDKLWELFRSLNKKLGTTIIIVTHDMSLADNVDRVVMISDGKIVSERVMPEDIKAK